MKQSSYDLVVIGSGPGGYIAAIRGAQLGLKTACIEKDPTLGGTCLNIGCIPSKALLESSHLYEKALHDMKEHGIVTEKTQLDLKQMLKRKDDVVSRLTDGVEQLFKKHKIDRLTGWGRITSPQEVEVKNGDEKTVVEAKKILIATGSVPASLPDIDIDEKMIVSSTGALSFKTVPDRLAVIGGGYIGLELGSVWSRLGSQVNVIEYGDRIVPTMDSEMGQLLQRTLKKQGLEFTLKAAVKAVQVSGKEVLVTYEQDGKSHEQAFDKVLLSVGRKPFVEGLGLEELNIEKDQRGFVKVNSQFQTNIPSIYAIGDVIGGAMLAHKAEEEGVACAELMVGEKPEVNYELVPGILYTHPELASVGASEQSLKEKGLPYTVGKYRFVANGRAIAAGEIEGMVKILAHKETDEILGAHILGPHASEMIHELCVAMEFSARAEDVALTMHGHPTLSEAVKEAALAVHKRTLNG